MDFTFALAPLLLVIFIDLLFSGDNMIIIGAITTSLPKVQQKPALVAGVAISAVCRIAAAGLAVWGLAEWPAIKVIGALALLWVAYGVYKDIMNDGEEDAKEPSQTFLQAMLAITAADLSMSVDNVLGVVGAAAGNELAIVIGLIASVSLMLVGAAIVAKLINRYPWIKWIGFGLILCIAAKMLYEGVPSLVAAI